MKGLSGYLIPVSEGVVAFWRDALVFRKLKKYGAYETAHRPELRFIMDAFTPFPDEEELISFRENPWNLVLKVVRGAILVNAFSSFMRSVLGEDPLSWYAGLYLAHSALDNNYLKYDRLLERPDLLGVKVTPDFVPLLPLPSTWNLQRWEEREKRCNGEAARITVYSIAQDLEGRAVSEGYDFVSFFLEGYDKIAKRFGLPENAPPIERFVELRRLLFGLKGVEGEEREAVRRELTRWGIQE